MTLQSSGKAELRALALNRSLVETMNKKNKGANVKPFMVKQYLSVFINCMIENPAFESQARPSDLTASRLS